MYIFYWHECHVDSFTRNISPYQRLTVTTKDHTNLEHSYWVSYPHIIVISKYCSSLKTLHISFPLASFYPMIFVYFFYITFSLLIYISTHQHLEFKKLWGMRWECYLEILELNSESLNTKNQRCIPSLFFNLKNGIKYQIMWKLYFPQNIDFKKLWGTKCECTYKFTNINNFLICNSSNFRN